MFFRQNKVDISRYLPAFLKSDVNFNTVQNSGSAEHERLRLLIQDVFAQFFVKTATWGLSSYERVLNITPLPDDDFEQRRLRILARYQFNQTTTVDFLEDLVLRYATQDSMAEVIEVNEEYYFKIHITGEIVYLRDLVGAVNLYKPAHLGWILAHTRRITQKTYVGFVLFNSKITSIPVNAFSLDRADAQIYSGLHIKLGKITKIKAKVA